MPNGKFNLLWNGLRTVRRRGFVMFADIKVLVALLLALVSTFARGGVVINEIMYHAPDDLNDLQFVELHNSGDAAVDLSGWAFSKGIKFTFAAGSHIDGKGFLVLCRNAERFKEFYTATVAGVFESSISRKGERIELTDGSGKVVDSLKFKDTAPWPTGADGYSGSLERISPSAAGDDPNNWQSSPISDRRDRPAGTPGQPNAAFSVQLPPVIANVKFSPEFPTPGQAITVEAEVRDASAPAAVNLLFRSAGPGFEKSETSLAMEKIPSIVTRPQFQVKRLSN